MALYLFYNMKTFKEFLSLQLDEELNDYQKKLVDNMPKMGHREKTHHDAVFGEGNDRMVIPYDDSKDEPITTFNFRNKSHPLSATFRVLDKLQGEGYRTDDYKSGLAYHHESPNRKMKIGKVLDKIGASDKPAGIQSLGKTPKDLTYKQAYDSDPYTSAKGMKQIVITRNRHDVAGMSTGRGWSSCMGLDSAYGKNDGGINKRYVKQDLEHGTLSAYLTRPGDDTIQNPIARVNIKQFTKGNSSSIYRPENRVYGTGGKEWTGAVDKWSKEKYPAEAGIYTKHHGLYDDDGDSVKMEKTPDFGSDFHKNLEDIDNILRNAHRQGKEAAEMREYKGDYEAMDEHHEHMENMTNKMYSKFDQKWKNLAALHHLAQDYDLANGREPNRVDEPNSKDEDDFQAEWARHRASNNNLAVNLTPDEAFEHHKKFHALAENYGDESHGEHHEEFMGAHADLIDHILSKGTPEHKNSLVHDLVGSNPAARDHYSSIADNYNTYLDGDNLVRHTTNPRTMHTIMNNDMSHLGRVHESFSGEDLEHIGKHADSKLAHEFWHDHARHMDVDLDSFVHGLNQNPHGEKIQHELTSGMVLTGGHNVAQKKTLDTNDVHPYKYQDTLTKTLGGHYINDGGNGHLREPVPVKASGYTQKPHIPGSHVDSSDSSDAVHKFGVIAGNTKFQSVADKLKTRHDTHDVPGIQNEIKNNHLVESAPGFLIPNEDKMLNKARYAMPQCKVEDIKSDPNLTTTNETVDTNTLIPTQDQFNWGKVSGLVDSGKPMDGVIVSNDNYVIDGHHRLLAAHNTSGKVGIVRVDMPMDKLLPYLKDAPYVMKKKLYESKTLKQFMIEAKESKRSITGELLKKMDRKKKKEMGVIVKPSKEKTEVDSEPTEQDLLTHDKVSESMILEMEFKPYAVSNIEDLPDTEEFKSPTIHTLENGEHIMSFTKDGYKEIHHHDGGTSDESGFRRADRQQPNPRWIGTMMQVAKHYIDLGHKVKIIGVDEPEIVDGVKKNRTLFENYHRLANIFAKKHGYFVHDPVRYTDDSGKKFGHVVIRKPSIKIGGDMERGIMETRTEDNGFVSPIKTLPEWARWKFGQPIYSGPFKGWE
jgi:hypothetical protein